MPSLISTYFFLYEQLQLILPNGAQEKSPTLAFYYCVTNYQKFNSLKRHIFVITVSMDQKSCYNLAEPSVLSHKAAIRCWLRLWSGQTLDQENLYLHTPSAFSIIHLLPDVVLKSLFSCFLSARVSTSQLLVIAHRPLSCDTLYIVNPLSMQNLASSKLARDSDPQEKPKPL